MKKVSFAVGTVAAALVGCAMAGCSGADPSSPETTEKTTQADGYTCDAEGTYTNQCTAKDNSEIGYCYRGVVGGLAYFELYFASEADMECQAGLIPPGDTILYEGNGGGYWQLNYSEPG